MTADNKRAIKKTVSLHSGYCPYTLYHPKKERKKGKQEQIISLSLVT